MGRMGVAREAGVRMEGGAGMGVLNSLAGRVLHDAGMECVTLDVEGDRKQWEDVSESCPAPCSLVVFGRPPLLVSRAQLSKDQLLNKVFTDRRGVRVQSRMEGGLWVFRPTEAFDLRRTVNERIRVCHLVVDLVGSPNPAEEWLRTPQAGGKPFRFNYTRTLF